MSRFSVLKQKMSKEEYKNFESKYAKLRLLWMNFETANMDNKHITMRHIHIVGTVMEEETVVLSTDRCNNEFTKAIGNFASCYEADLIKALYTLKYFDYATLKNDIDMAYGYVDKYFYTGNSILELPESLPMEDRVGIRYDQLGIFVSLFGRTLKVKKYKKKSE